MKARMIVEAKCMCKTCRTGSGGCREFPDRKIPVGTVKDGPDVWKLVRMGMAEPADDECEKAANMTPLKMARAQHAQRRTAAGIVPEDYEIYDAGEISGYYPDGSNKPGPHAIYSEGGLILDGWDTD